MNELPTLIDNDLLDAEAEHEINLVISPDAEGRLDAWLASQVPELSRARIQVLMKEGRITCEGETVKATHRPKPGNTIRILIPIPISAIPQPEAIPLTIVYEDAISLSSTSRPGLSPILRPDT